ncbi:zinc carboxypeptidase A 1-like [Epargyreus clarus]|uniref:zinc carboxypeptidase A 1-like n=1 Tax=Epargyreus clarus TaxID=520877 RepID=UPI003C30D504
MAIFIVAGEEGRDWLSSALVLNYINKILESATSPESLLNYYEFYFIPIINPDGFVYSKQEDRFWAKNRKVFQPSRLCSENNAAVGVNIDRNWFFQSGHSINAICNSIYIGNRPLSEEETRALSYILNKIAINLMAFVNLRGFGNLIALPYADRSEISSNHYVVLEIMKHVSSIINKQYNTSYPVGTTENYFYNFSGNMADWVKRNLNIPIVLTLYMNNGKFLPQEDQILPLSNHLDLLLNITLTISRDIYGSLYNKGVKHNFTWILLVLSFNSWIYYG